MPIALTRPVSLSLAACELTYQTRQPIDIDRARAQHREYAQALREAGCSLVSLPEAAELPDAVFVEDLAVVLDEVAILTRPGVASRRPESASIEAALAPHRPLRRIETPGTLEGGDILRLGRTIYVGRSVRSNAEGIRQLRDRVAPFGYRVEAVSVHGCLHLKSAVTDIAPDRLLVNPRWVDAAAFGGMGWMCVDEGEAHAANALRVGTKVIYPAGFPRTLEMLVRAGVEVRPVDVSEIQKAEGAVTCCSLIFEARTAST